MKQRVTLIASNSEAFPLGHDQHGLPFGVQLMGRRWDDAGLLTIAGQVSELAGGFQRPLLV